MLPTTAPFILELRCEEIQENGTFTPAAAVLLTPQLHTSGLLRDLSPEALHTLLGVLASVTANGSFAATPELLAPAFGLSPGRMRERLRRLTTLTWQEKPLLSEQVSESGMRTFTPAPALLAIRHSLIVPGSGRPGTPISPPHYLGSQSSGPPVRGGFREQVIARSRSLYGRPRAQVEADINRFLQGKQPLTVEPPVEEEETPTTPAGVARLALKRRLLARGLTLEQATLLLDTYPLPRIEQQVEWLPLRHARNPVGFLMAAIEGDYEPPLAVRLQAIENEADGEIGETAEEVLPAESVAGGEVTEVDVTSAGTAEEHRLPDSTQALESAEEPPTTVELELPPEETSPTDEKQG